MAKKIVALDVLTEILKKVYAKAKEYTNGQIATEVKILRPLITTNSNDIKKLQSTTSDQQESINGLSSSVSTLQSKLGIAESNITTLENELAAVKSDVAVLQSKVYDYLGNDEIDKVFEEASEGV